MEEVNLKITTAAQQPRKHMVPLWSYVEMIFELLRTVEQETEKQSRSVKHIQLTNLQS